MTVAAPTPPTLLYILGSGRSGSTLLERVLHSSPDLTAVGELHALWRLPLDRLLCTCGQPLADCLFWTEALATARIGPREVARLAHLERRVVRNRHLFRLGYRPEALAADPGITEFVGLQRRLFDGIRAASGAATVLDSSKAGPRAWILAAGLSPVFLHTRRAAAPVIASWRRPKTEPSTGLPMPRPPVARAALDWLKAERAARRLARVAPLRRLDHATFAERPRETLAAALDPLLPGCSERVAWTGPRTVRPAGDYHSVLGNPDRFGRDEITIRPPAPVPLPAVERLMVSVVGRMLDRACP